MKFGFVINAYNEAAQMRECLKYLRASYPRETVLIIADDDYFTDYDGAMKPYFNVFTTRGPRLRTHPTGGRWIERFLYAGLRHFKDADYIIKLDPDTRILRPLSFIPLPDGDRLNIEDGRPLLKRHIAPDIFGFLRPRVDLRRGIETEHFPTLAFVGIHREAAQQILDSGILLDKRFEDPYYDGDSHKGIATGEHLSVASWILFDAAKELGLSIAHHPEVYLKWREPVPESEWDKWAVVNVESSPWGKAVTAQRNSDPARSQRRSSLTSVDECVVSAVSDKTIQTHCQCEGL